MKINFDLTLSKSQKEMYELVHNDDYKFITIVASRQQGKSVVMKVLCIEWLCESGNSIAYICRNFKLAETFFDDLMRVIPPSIIKLSNKSKHTIESIYGSRLSFGSAEQGASFRGQTYTHMILDELSFHKQLQPDGTQLWYDILSPTLKVMGKKCVALTTPLGRKNIAYDFYYRGISDDYPKWTTLVKTVYDDAFTTPEEIEETRRTIPPITFQREYMCEFDDEGMSFFQGFAQCFDIEKQGNGKKWIGIDLSGDGTDSTIVTSINEGGEVHQYEVRGNLDHKYAKIAEIIDNINPTATYIEINGLGAPMANEIKKLVKHRSKLYDWTTTNSTKEEIVSDLAVAIANREIHFEKDDKMLSEELEGFVCTSTKGNRLKFEGLGTKDDRVMSLAIALKCKNDFKFLGTNPNKFIPSGVRLLK